MKNYLVMRIYEINVEIYACCLSSWQIYKETTVALFIHQDITTINLHKVLIVEILRRFYANNGKSLFLS